MKQKAPEGRSIRRLVMPLAVRAKATFMQLPGYWYAQQHSGEPDAVIMPMDEFRRLKRIEKTARAYRDCAEGYGARHYDALKAALSVRNTKRHNDKPSGRSETN